MVNYNPETVSTDYDMCDRLYFEELSFEVPALLQHLRVAFSPIRLNLALRIMTVLVFQLLSPLLTLQTLLSTGCNGYI